MDETTLRLLPPLRAAWALRGEQAQVPISGKNDSRSLFGALDLRSGRRMLMSSPKQRLPDMARFLRRLRAGAGAKGALWLLLDAHSTHHQSDDPASGRPTLHPTLLAAQTISQAQPGGPSLARAQGRVGGQPTICHHRRTGALRSSLGLQTHSDRDLVQSRAALGRLLAQRTTQNTLAAHLERKRPERRDGKLPQVGHRPKFDDFAQKYLTSATLAQKKQRMQNSERQAIGRWSTYLGGIRLDKITPPVIHSYREKRLGKGTSARTVNLYTIALRNVLMCLRANGRMDEALVAMSQAYRLRPGSFNAQVGLDKTAEAVTARVRQPPPAQNLHRNNPFAEIQQVEAIDRANQQRMSGQGKPLPGTGATFPLPGHPQDFSRQPPSQVHPANTNLPARANYLL